VTSISLGDWKQAQEPPRIAIRSDTRGISSHGVVFLQGRYVTGQYGIQELMVSFDPVAFERKLAIRQLNERLEGRTITSDTLPENSATRR
jgi:hypothetical protein